MKLLVDMNLSPRWIRVLADAGIDAAHWSTLGANNAPDSQIMSYAHANDYVVLTHDLDFSAILAATHGEKPSVVQIRADDVSPDVMGGKACIRGMRVTVGMVVGQIGSGHSIDEVLADYPYLENEDIMQALRYAAWRAEEREVMLATA